MNIDNAKQYLIDNLIDIDNEFIEKYSYTILDNQNNDIDICLTECYKWLGYNTRQNLEHVLFSKKNGFIKNFDYTITTKKTYNKKGGRPTKEIKITADCFRTLGMLAPTPQGKKIRIYYLQMEKMYKKYLAENNLNVSFPIKELHEYDVNINNYMNKEVLYFFNIKDNIYKFGITRDLSNRLCSLRREIEYNYMVKCWLCENKTISIEAEKFMKQALKIHKSTTTYNGLTEIIITDNIKIVVKLFDIFVDKAKNNYHSGKIEDVHKASYDLLSKLANVISSEILTKEEQQKLISKCIGGKKIDNTNKNTIIIDENKERELRISENNRETSSNSVKLAKHNLEISKLNNETLISLERVLDSLSLDIYQRTSAILTWFPVIDINARKIKPYKPKGEYTSVFVKMEKEKVNAMYNKMRKIEKASNDT